MFRDWLYIQLITDVLLASGGGSVRISNLRSIMKEKVSGYFQGQRGRGSVDGVHKGSGAVGRWTERRVGCFTLSDVGQTASFPRLSSSLPTSFPHSLVSPRSLLSSVAHPSVIAGRHQEHQERAPSQLHQRVQPPLLHIVDRQARLPQPRRLSLSTLAEPRTQKTRHWSRPTTSLVPITTKLNTRRRRM